MRHWGRIAARVLLAAVVLAGWTGWARWRRWQQDLPPLPAPGHAESVAVNVLAEGDGTAAEIPFSELAYPRWRMELRRLFVRRGDHVRTWLVAARVSGVPASPRETAEVWAIGIEGWCREIGMPRMGPGPAPPVPPTALCWDELVYHGDTGRPWWGLGMGFALR